MDISELVMYIVGVALFSFMMIFPDTRDHFDLEDSSEKKNEKKKKTEKTQK
ncbi:hypothetical protein [Bacillus sp. M6-12]|uniref:hypothetical protein n=1 Tax=Bacillus sp. M6-12 TaxID=2054166 RepID=UPI0015E086D0|nr:hypothetical protein [Bacillus sp. M6-12]